MRYIVVLMFSIVSFGCEQQGPKTYPVTGTVTYEGKEVTNGDIFFVPTDPTMAPDAGKIEAGRFSARAKEGLCRVEITALNIGPDTPVVMGSPVAENYIPVHYNRESQLEVQVSASGENVFEFDLTSAKPKP